MIKYLKPSIFSLSLLPFLIITYKIFFNKSGPEPVKEITHFTGEWTLIFICLTPACIAEPDCSKVNPVVPPVKLEDVTSKSVPPIVTAVFPLGPSIFCDKETTLSLTVAVINKLEDATTC